MMATAKGIPHGGDKPIGGNRRKIEDLMIENLMNKAEKVSATVEFKRFFIILKPSKANIQPLKPNWLSMCER